MGAADMEIRNIDDKTNVTKPMPIQRVSMPRTSSTYYHPSGPFKELILRAQNVNTKAGRAEDSEQPQNSLIGDPPNDYGPTPATRYSPQCPKCRRDAFESNTHYACPKCGLVVKKRSDG